MIRRIISVFMAALLVLAFPVQAVAYNEADHFYLTYMAARMAGLSAEDSMTVASAAVAVDQSKGTNPLPNLELTPASAAIGANPVLGLAAAAAESKRMVKVQLNNHSFSEPTKGEAGVLTRMNRLYDRAVADDGNLDRLGVYMHAVGDYYAHQRGGRHFGAGVGHGVCITHSHSEEARQFKINALKKGNVVDWAKKFGEAPHWVDQMKNRPDENRRMLRHAYFQIQKFAEATGRSLNPPVDQKKAMEFFGTFKVDRLGDDYRMNRDLTEMLRENNIKNVVIPSYESRRGDIVIDEDGNPTRRKPTAEDLKGDAVLPVVAGEREQRLVDALISEIIPSRQALTGFPLPPEIVEQMEAAARTAGEKGVRISYDRHRLRAAVAGASGDACDPAADQILREFSARPDAWMVDVDETTVALSIARLMRRGENPPTEVRALGWIRRVVGYVVDDANGDIVILATPGEVGVETLTLDDLAVIIKSVWEQGRTPICSLDPKPGQSLEAGFITRVEGVPRASRFGNVMLDADYDMKRIGMGLDPLNIAGMKTVYDHQVVRATVDALQGTSGKGHLSRFWLTPIQPNPGDIRVSAGGRVVLFRSRVQVLTEVMIMAQEGMIGTHRMDPADEKGVREFTKNYDRIAEKRENFAKLNALFDLTLMAGLMREHLPACPLLDQLSRRRVAPVPIHDAAYAVLHKDLNGRPFIVGGCEALFPDPVRAVKDFDGTEQVAALLRKMGEGGTSDSTRSKRDEYFFEAVEKFWEGRAAAEQGDGLSALKAINRSKILLNRAIRRDRDFTAAYLLRAFIRLETQTEIDRAMKDCDQAIMRRPDLARPYLYRGLGHLYLALQGTAGVDPDRALQRAAASITIAINKDPDDPLAYLIRGNVGVVQVQAGEAIMTWDFDINRVTFRTLETGERMKLFEVEADLNKALHLAEDDETMVQVQLMRGYARGMLRDFDGARSDFAEGLRNENPQALMYAAAAELFAGNDAVAERHANRCLKAFPMPLAYTVRAAVRFNRGEYRAAREDLETAHRQDPSGGDETLQIIESLRGLERR